DDYLYLQPSRKPFTSAYLGKQLRETGQQVYEHYTPYISRHWCAVARLIQTKIKTGHYDCYVVKNWLDMTRSLPQKDIFNTLKITTESVRTIGLNTPSNSTHIILLRRIVCKNRNKD
ncbi:MAG: hypothetical protein NTX92_02310, partial [Euryarchaeota archaeon]|nr:hypothetical protein [Euryarchaeota archaeon]